MPHQEYKKTLMWNNTCGFMRKYRGHFINYPLLPGWEQFSYIDCMAHLSKFLEIKQSTLCVS